MNIIAFIIFVFVLQAICLVIGGKSSKELKNQDDYFLAGKNIRLFPLVMTFLATQVGGGLVLGAAEEAYQFGWSVLFYPLGSSLGLILLGLGTGRKLAQFNVSTVAQILEVAYRSAILKQIASILSIVSLFMIFVAQVIASNKFMISLGVDSRFCFLAFWSLVIFYTAMGGLKAVVATDIVQASFFIGVFVICLGFVLSFTDISIMNVVESSINNQSFSFDSSKLYGWLFMPLLFMVIEQDMGQRCFAAESPGVVSKATLLAGAGTFGICAIPVFFGVLAKNLGIVAPTGASILITAVSEVTHPIVAALVGCAILAALISTADSLINAISSNLSQDFKLSFLKKENMRVIQGLTGGIAVFGVACSFYFTNVVDLLIQSYELSVSCLFIPIFIALFKKQGNLLSASLSIGAGTTGFILFKFVQAPIPKELASVLISLAGYYIGEAWVWSRQLQTKQEGASV